jgi:hypothetical protein
MHFARRLTFAAGAALAVAVGGASMAQAAPLVGLGQAAAAVKATAKPDGVMPSEKTYYRRYYRRHYYGYYRPRYYGYYRPYYRPYGLGLFPFF